MRKRVNLINRVSALVLSFFLALGLITPAFSITAHAEAAEVLESSATVADCVMSYYAMSGNAVANTEWINTLYDSLGSSFGTIGDFANNSLMTYVDGVWQPTETLVQNIESASAYTELGLDSVFNVSAQEVANGGGYAVATGASTLGGAVSCVATHGILPVLGGVTAAYWGGVALGTLAVHLWEKYSKCVDNGMPMTMQEALDSMPSFSSIVNYRYINSRYPELNTNIVYYVIDENATIFSTRVKPADSDTTSLNIYIYNPNGRNTSSQYFRRDLNNSSLEANNFSYSNNLFQFNNFWQNNPSWSYSYQIIPYKSFSSSSEQIAYLDDLRNGRADPPVRFSPDLIGALGNLKKGDGIDLPSILPSIDTGVESGKPLTKQQWLNFANGVENNNSTTSPLPNNQSLLNDLINALKAPLPSGYPSDNPGTNPNPDPGGETYPVPGPVPDPSPVPDPEYQPETKPQPEYTEKPTENETDITEGDPWTTPDLLDKFPFCIPRDVYRVFTKLDSGARAAPHIQWRFNPNDKIDYTFDIDFSEWDNVATLLRTLELLGFIVALAVATRKMILS